jgi:uncharacterized repeat protein (TIGR01451 family)
MGRRLMIPMGLVLILACQSARADDDKKGEQAKDATGSASGSNAAPLPPFTPAAPGEADLDLEAGGKPSAGQEPGALPAVGELPAPEGLPAVADDGVKPVGSAKAPPAGGSRRMVPAPRDSMVQQAADPAALPSALEPGKEPAPAPLGAQRTPPPAVAPGPAAEPAPPAGEGHLDGQGFVLPPDQLPLGKQQVALSVEVQAPSTMTYNREATVKIIVKNSGSADALGVTVRDELPQGLEYVSSQPEAQPVVGPLLSWRISTLPAGAERIILLKVRPMKSGGTMEHAATATFQAGSKATTRVQRPQIKLEVVQSPPDGKVLINKPAEFRITLTNTGDGPARNVVVQAKLSGGLRHETGERNEENTFELPIQELAAGQREELDPLTVDAIQGGEHWCQVSVSSSDVDFNKETMQVRRAVKVVQPKLKMVITAPEWRYTDTVGGYSIVMENPGDAPARNVKVEATLGVSGRIVTVPPDAKYDAASRRLRWTIPQIDPGGKSRPLPFEIRMGGVNSAFEVNVEARGDDGLLVRDRKMTDVRGMADVDLVVQERRRVVDVDGSTTFQIRLRNYGTKEASRIQLSAALSENLIVDATAGGPEEQAQGSPDGHEVTWPLIPRLGPGKEMVLAIKVKVTKAEPRIGTCRVYLLHDDLSVKLEDMAAVKITESRRAAVGP